MGNLRLSRNWQNVKILTVISALVLFPSYTLAQITPDSTLGNENSIVNKIDALNDRIDGGARRGGNLFHSFQEFNINQGKGVYFANPSGVINIFSRVTGGNASQILGVLGVLGKSNLFLINPYGIIFGKNAKLDISGSFVGTTASSIKFGSQGDFSAINPEKPPLLTIQPDALVFTQINAIATIVNQASLKVPNQKSLLIVGGEIKMIGGSAIALNGRVELVGILDLGTIGLNDQFHLNVPNDLQLANITLTQKAKVDAASGTVVLTGQKITLTDSSTIVADIQDNKNGQRMIINASHLSIQDGSQITSTAKEKSQGNSGGITVNATETVEVIGTSNNEQDSKPSKLSSDAQGEGSAGGLIINTKYVRLEDGGKITSSTIDQPDGGNILINASESVELIGRASQRGRANDRDRASAISVQTRGEGKAGDITINTQRLKIQEGAEIIASTFGTGDGGDIIINASDLIYLDGTTSNNNSNDPIKSRIVAETGQELKVNDRPDPLIGTGNGGNISINSQNLTIQNGAEISTSSFQKTGNAGNLTIRVQNTLQSNNGTISTLANEASGGNITISAQDIRLRGNSDIRTNVASGVGGGGDITLTAEEILAFDDSDILAFAQNGIGGNISLNTPIFFGNGYQATDQVNQNPDTLDNNDRVDINASGAVSGVISVPDLTFIQNSLFELPETLINTENLIASSCVIPNQQKAGTFILTGPDGLPTRPNNNLTSPYPTGTIETIPTPSPSPKIDEPQGFYRLNDGTIVLSKKCY
ncbi:hypothetical protein C7H19_16015 [Aphanothece hegewaldii CCALA 016]|uniref:Filamentous haemagglutinin FhaB/tRNA nuclease CdiA-like TPS domain-containing protein n=1 Tax=Aphanothece hegewaldii CCALA 016 TaxID=2107694 RepID=A0A2T1LV14_9CHRO|nr:filamentous hemagglutinin N-terminal domain-containing protein [Aphanothece hegewaldii]PSF35519.1 hypothetical protein C7H19_16015 [Aphanothece hegewaldii CCALA 016]